jgi:hypothetical protein
MRMEKFRKLFAFIIGALIVVGGLIDECPRVGAIAIGLLMMGIFTVPDAVGIIRGEGKKDGNIGG